MTEKADTPTEQRRGRPRTMSDADLRARLAAAAMRVFVERGFAKATTADIAREAKVSKRDLYRVYDDKTALFAEAIRSRKHLILALPRPSGDALQGRAALRAVFRLDLTDAEADARDALLGLVARESLLLPELNALLYDSRILESRELLMDWLHREIRTGRWPACDVPNIAGLMMDVVFGALLPRRRPKGPIDRARQAQLILDRLEIVRLGLKARPQEGAS